jgi:hypothetical protein
MRRSARTGVWLVTLLVMLPGAAVTVGWSERAIGYGSLHVPRVSTQGAFNSTGLFVFVADFEHGSMGGWHPSQGNASIVTSPSYAGEPSLSSSAGAALPQVEIANRSFVPGAPSLSFRADLYYAGGGTGFVGLAGAHGPVAMVGVGGGSVWAGANLTTLTKVRSIPTGTAQPAGWVDLMASLAASTGGNSTAWTMQVYVDRTDTIAASNVSVPNASGYSGAILETTKGTVDYTDLVFTSNQIPITIPGYNNMEGYGQGSGLTAALLPGFTTLTATMTVANWSIPQQNILSYQINAMSYVGTVRSTCHGFYQLGIDLNPGGRIAPWFVPDGNCVAHYFNSKHPTSGNRGFVSPPGTRLELSIHDNTSAGTIEFAIHDLSISGPNRSLTATIPYNGTRFYGAYSQVEWQPCCSSFPIRAYFLNASLRAMTIAGGGVPSPTLLSGSYMVPYVLDAPPSWSLTYYRTNVGAYDQVI